MTARAMTRVGVPAEFLNRYLLPKVALTVISIASLAGTYLSMTTHGAPATWAVVRWLHLVALGTLAGGAMWWAFFVARPAQAREIPDVARLAVAQQRRFRVIGAVALLAAILSAPHLVWFGRWAMQVGQERLWVTNGIVLLIGLASAGWLLYRRPDRQGAFATGAARWTWALLTLTLALTAVLDARLSFPAQPGAWILRPLHLVAFGLWIGGAIWNIFIAVPAAQETLSMPVVVSAAQQLERFRWVVRAILPTLVITGLFQALPYTGLSLAGLFFGPFGWLILFKLGLIVALVAIFLTCPMWRACSPVRGVCDLEDLAAPALPEPTRRLDNRGKACAGFVYIQQALETIGPADVLELLSTDPISWWELPAWLEKHGLVLLHREYSGRLWWQTYRYLIKKEDARARGNYLGN